MSDEVVIPTNAVESSASYYWREVGNIVYIFNKQKALHTTEDALENIIKLRELVGGIPPLLLINVTLIKSMTRGAREVYAREGVPKRVKAVALLTKSTLSRIIANFFIGFNKPEVPTKLFNDEDAARRWLKENA